MTTRYTRDHEWIRLNGSTALIGISNYAQEQLGDVVFVELPEVGKKLEKGAVAAVVESVKAASEVFAPAAGEVVEVNGALADTPGLVNDAAEDVGWFVKMKLANPAEIEGLMDEAAYKAFLETI
jgi:glycine cleavage system H protein